MREFHFEGDTVIIVSSKNESLHMVADFGIEELILTME